MKNPLTDRATARRAFIGLLLGILVVSLGASTQPLRFRDFYSAGVEFSAQTRALDGQRVVISGFMAPPLKPDADFFVLTRLPMEYCPFCSSEAEWPDDIVFVRTRRTVEPIRFNRLLEVEGTLSLGVDVDEETGFVSLMRLEDAVYRAR